MYEINKVTVVHLFYHEVVASHVSTCILPPKYLVRIKES